MARAASGLARGPVRPRLLIGTGALLSGLRLGRDGLDPTIAGLYLTYGLMCGLGTGIVYIGVVGLMVKWFPERRGFATGVAASGYGFGAILTTFPIDDMIRSSGYEQTLVIFGSMFAAVGLLAALFLRRRMTCA